MKQTKLFFTCITFFFFIWNGLAQPGSLDHSFNSADYGYWKNNSLDGAVTCMYLQSDGKMLVAGYFSRFNENKIGNLIRVNADGTLDANFQNANQYPPNIKDVLVQSDGKILISGSFRLVNGIVRNSIARLNADGSMDTTFDPGSGIPYSVLVTARMVLQKDGKIIIGGNFKLYNGIAVNNLVRIHSNGSIDTSYSTTGVDGTIKSMALQDDDKLLIGGSFTKYNNESVNHLARIHTDGSLDNSFHSGLSSGIASSVHSLFLQKDKKIMITGIFNSYQGAPRKAIARINEDGNLDFSFEATSGIFNGELLKTFVQPDLKTIVFESFGLKGSLTRLNQDGTKDTGFAKAEGNGNITCALQQTDGKLIIGGWFTLLGSKRRNYIACLKTDGSIDLPFNTEGLGINGLIQSVVIQKDGKLIIGGSFTTYNGKIRTNVARLHPDGSLDTTFNSKIDWSDMVTSIALQEDGKILVGGLFEMNTPAQKNVIRLHPDGSPDISFNSSPGAESFVDHLAIQTDGKIIIVGSFTKHMGFPLNGIARLNTNGTVDTTFKIGSGVEGYAEKIVIQPDGKIVIAGYVTGYNGVQINNLVRLNTDGSLNSTFQNGSGPDDFVQDMYLQPNGQLVIAGRFKTVDGKTANQLARINSDGTLDNTFSAGLGIDVSLNTLNTVVVQPDGKIITAGRFNSFNGTPANSIVRLNSDGSRDHTFEAGLGIDNDKIIYTALLQPDEKIIIGGSFTSYNGNGRNKIARIHGSKLTTVNEQFHSSSLTIYPNPSQGSCQLNLNANTELIIYDVYGRVLFQQALAEGVHQLDLSHEPNGLYFISAINKGSVVTQKISIAR